MNGFDSQTYYALKVLKSISGLHNKVSISSGDLADKMGVSQQSASRVILELVSKGYITRTLENRKQSISITESGLEILYTELSNLSHILNLDSTITIGGRVESGLGEGRYYISRKYYIVQFQERLGFIPYLGTLNIKVKPEFENLLRRLRSSTGIHIEGFETDDRTFGPVKAFNAKIRGVSCAVILPERSVYSDVIEVISKDFLREKFGLQDGDNVIVDVDLTSSYP